MVKVWPYFHKSIWVTIVFCFFNFFVPKAYVLKVLNGVLFLKELWVFILGFSKLKNNINDIKYKFSHRFGKVCKWLNMYYSKIRLITFLKIKSCPFESFKKILYGLIRNLMSTNIEVLNTEFTIYLVFVMCVICAYFTH
jgi:hypothetical protein